MLAGCGYSSPYLQSSQYDRNKDGLITIYLEMWDNQTNLLGLQATIQQSLTNWLKRSQRFVLTQQRQQADFVLAGAIHAVDLPGTSFNQYDHATSLSLKLRMSYSLTERKTGKVVINNQGFSKQDSFSVGGDAIRTRSNQQAVLTNLADSLADEVYIQLFYLFTRNDLTEDRPVIPTSDITAIETN